MSPRAPGRATTGTTLSPFPEPDTPRMDRRKLLLTFLLLWVVAVAGGGAWRLIDLGKITARTGPQALARDGQGGVYLATGDELLRLDADGNVKSRHLAAALGMADLNALAPGEGNTLFVHESAQRRVLRCDTRDWRCTPFSPANLGLDVNVQMAWLYGAERRLLLSDNSHHRLLALDEYGHRLPLPGTPWHFPNQVSTGGGQALLADSDSRRIVHLDPVANTATGIALATRERPYRFVRRDTHWWVLEAGVRLEQAELRHYVDGRGETLALDVKDPVALLDGGRQLLVASKDDWGLVAVDPDTGVARRFGSPALQHELRARRAGQEAARGERRRLPLLMLLLMAPALGGGLWLQRRIDRVALPATGDAAEAPRPAAAAFARPLAATSRARQVARIDTDRAALATARTLQNAQLLRAGVIGLPLLLVLGGLLWWLMPAPGRAALVPLLVMLLLLPLLLALALYSGRRQQDRRYDQHLLCGPDKVVHVVAGKALRAVPYSLVWLGEDSLILGKQRLPLYMGYGTRRSALWQLGELQRELGTRIPHTQHLGEVALGRTLLARGQLAGLSVLSGRFLVIILVVLVLLLKLWSLLPHGAITKLWTFFA